MIDGRDIRFPEVAVLPRVRVLTRFDGVQNLVGPGKFLAEMISARVRIAVIGPLIEVQHILGAGQCGTALVRDLGQAVA